MPVRVILLLLLFLCSCQEQMPVHQTGSTKAEANYQKSLSFLNQPDSMIFYADKALRFSKKSDSIYPKLLDCKIYANNIKKDYQTSISLAEQLYNHAIKHKDTSNMALALYRKALAYRKLDDQTKVFENSFKSRQLYLAKGDSSKAGKRSLEMANAQIRRADLHGAQLSATESLKLLNHDKDSIYMVSAHNVIAMAYENLGFADDALKEYENALRFAENYDEVAAIQQNMALLHTDHPNLDKALEKFIAIDTAAIKSSNLKFKIRENIAYVKWQINPQYPAGKEIRKILNFQLNHQNSFDAGNSYYYLSKILAKRKPDSALYYARKWHQLSSKNFDLSDQIGALKSRMEFEPPSEKLKLIDEYIQLTDSIRKVERLAKNSFAKIRYDEENKQRQILALENQNFQQKVETSKFRNTLFYSILLILLLVISGLFFLYYLKQKHRAEKIMKIQETENRISKVVHDEIANDLYNVMNSLETTGSKVAIDKLENVYERTRAISRQNNPIDTGEFYADNLKGMLSNSAGKRFRLFLNGFEEIPWNKISAEKKIVIYRVLQELIINSRKHSEATLIAIHFGKKIKHYFIQYSDNGVGLPKEFLENQNGLQNTENRILSVKGSIKFDGEKGFRATIHIPA